MQSSSTVSTTTGDAAASTGTDIFSANVTVSNTLQDAMKSNTSDSTGFTTLESTEKTSILPDKIDLSKEKVAVFKENKMYKRRESHTKKSGFPFFFRV